MSLPWLSPRSHRRAAALVLLAGSAAVIATSPPDSWHQEASLQGRPIRLDAGSPAASRSLSVVVTQSSASDKGVYGGLSVELSARWIPPAGDAAAAKPWFRARLVRDGMPQELKVFVLEGTDSSGALPLYTVVFSKPCVETRRCETSFQLEVERQAEPIGGVVEVDWSASVDVRGPDDELEVPKGLEVQLTEN